MIKRASKQPATGHYPVALLWILPPIEALKYAVGSWYLHGDSLFFNYTPTGKKIHSKIKKF
jgi:hypothetical protein